VIGHVNVLRPQQGGNWMNVQAVFGLSILLSFLAFGLVAKLYVWPQLRMMKRDDALLPLVAVHMFRFVGLAFLVPGVVSPSLPTAFTHPAAYGDLVATLLAVLATFALSQRLSWANVIVWALNVWGTGDLLYAMYQGQIGVGIDIGALGSAYFIPTIVVPALLTTHTLIFLLLLRRSKV
jgi:hypothetical protein